MKAIRTTLRRMLVTSSGVTMLALLAVVGLHVPAQADNPGAVSEESEVLSRAALPVTDLSHSDANRIAEAINNNPESAEYAIVVSGSSPDLPPPAPGARHGNWVVLSYPFEVDQGVTRITYDTSHNVDDHSTMTAGGCSPLGHAYATCMNVYGKGLDVDEWSTDAYLPCRSTCSTNYQVHYLRNWVSIKISYKSDFRGAGRYLNRWWGPLRFSDRDRLCNWWPDSVFPDNKPCITIKK